MAAGVRGVGFERDSELATLSAVYDRSRAGSGGLVLVDGAPGIGKTHLLSAAVDLAKSHDALVLRAAGSEFEHDFPFGIVRQLFEPAVRALDPARAAEMAGSPAALGMELLGTSGALLRAEPTVGLLHGIYWLTVELASDSPLVLVVDDAQWADDVSLRALGYLARRLEGVAATILVASRERAWSPASALAALFTLPEATRIALRPLSVDGTAALVAELSGGDVDADVAAACHAAAGGNPFLLGELVRAGRSGDGHLTREAVERIQLLAPESLASALMLRLGALPADALAVARAVAILGDPSPPRLAAAFCGLSAADIVAAADALITAGVFVDQQDLSFVHPLVRAAVYGSLSAVARGDGHRCAAALLREDGAEPERIAPQLLASVPAADPQTAELLVAAAASASARGAFDVAARLLARALEEPPAPDRVGQVLAALGRAELADGNEESATQHLRAALGAGLTDEERASTAISLAHAVGGERAIEILDDAASRVAGEHALRLEIERISVSMYMLDRTSEAWERARRFSSLSGRTATERLALAEVAFATANDPEASAASVARIAELALGGDRLLAEQGGDATACFHATFALLGCERFAAVARQVELLLEDARIRGSRFAFFAGSCAASTAALMTGDLAAAIAHGEAAEQAAVEVESSQLGSNAAWIARPTMALLERGDVEEAADALSGLRRQGPAAMGLWFLDLSIARVALAQGEYGRALESFLAYAERATAIGHESRLSGWRLGAARAAAALGRTDEAVAYANEQVGVERVWGARGALGDALRVAAVIGDPDEAPRRLSEAIAMLRRSERRLVLAHALVDLGVALRRARQRVASRDALSEGLDLATACGARPLVERARSELKVAGARPRRDRITGRDALTPSEQRIAELAARGLTNRHIAQELFVTPKSVELRLTSIYRKLDIPGRAHLAATLGSQAT